MMEGAEPLVSIDLGLLSPITVEHDQMLSDPAMMLRLITAEVALAGAWADLGVAPEDAAETIEAAFIPAPSDPEAPENGFDVPHALQTFDLDTLIRGSVAGGNPVIPLVGMMRQALPSEVHPWVHRGATSQDILDTALMVAGLEVGLNVMMTLSGISEQLRAFARAHRNTVAAARTLTQHAVPTTVGARAANWVRGIDRAARRLEATLSELPAQLGGAGGTLASFAQIAGHGAARDLPGKFAERLGLAAPAAPWHTTRWPVTELGDALVQVIDALGKMAADVATLSRTEISELAEGTGGGSSAMPQKRNPAESVLIRSAAIRAPHLGATLHSASALAVDERPDGAWHAEWPTLRELMRLTLGASAHALSLIDGLRVDEEAVARNLALTSGGLLAERLNIVLAPHLGADRVKQLIMRSLDGEDLATLLRAEPAIDGIDVEGLLDAANYTGLAGDHVDAIAPHQFS